MILEKVPFLAVSVASLFVATLSLQSAGTLVSSESIPMGLRTANALVCYVKYIVKMIWPQNLAVFYPYPAFVPVWQSAGALVFLICISVMVFRHLREKPYLVVGWLWYLGALVPVVGFVQAGLWPEMADRWAYVPLIGVFIIIAWGIHDLVAEWRWRKIVLALSSGMVLLGLMRCTWLQNRHWTNTLTLFQHAVNVTANTPLSP